MILLFVLGLLHATDGKTRLEAKTHILRLPQERAKNDRGVLIPVQNVCHDCSPNDGVANKATLHALEIFKLLNFRELAQLIY